MFSEYLLAVILISNTDAIKRNVLLIYKYVCGLPNDTTGCGHSREARCHAAVMVKFESYGPQSLERATS